MDVGNVSKNKMGIFLIFGILLIFNIIFFILCIGYVVHNIGNFDLTFEDFSNFYSIIASLIILGFISTRLPRLRQNDNSLYEIGYLIILGTLSIVISYFNKGTVSDSVIYPYISVFKILSILLILLVIATKSKAFKSIMHNKIGRKATFYTFIFFAIVAVISTVYYIDVHDSMVSVRDLMVMISGLFGGPYVGIPVGILTGIIRYSYGGATALPAALSALSAGVISSLIYVFNGRKFLKMSSSVVLMFLFTGYSMLLVIVCTPPYISVDYVIKIYPLMLFSSILGMILFKMIVKEQKSGKTISYEELRIMELENTLDEYDEKISQLEEDVELLKKMNDLD